MKTMMLMGLLGLMLGGCKPAAMPGAAAEKVTWQYRTLVVGNSNEVASVKDPKWSEKSSREKELDSFLPIYGHALGDLGREGWELVGCVPEIETVWTTGQKFPNTRTSKVTFVFKRPL